jgi:hypothetical protein
MLIQTGQTHKSAYMNAHVVHGFSQINRAEQRYEKCVQGLDAWSVIVFICSLTRHSIFETLSNYMQHFMFLASFDKCYESCCCCKLASARREDNYERYLVYFIGVVYAFGRAVSSVLSVVFLFCFFYACIYVINGLCLLKRRARLLLQGGNQRNHQTAAPPAADDCDNDTSAALAAGEEKRVFG